MANDSVWSRLGIGLIIALAAGGASFVAGTVRTETTVQRLTQDLWNIEGRLDELQTSVTRLQGTVSNLPPSDLLLRVRMLETEHKSLKTTVEQGTRDRYYREDAKRDLGGIRDRLRRLEDQIYGTIVAPRGGSNPQPQDPLQLR